jgi:hypothetical protein
MNKLLTIGILASSLVNLMPPAVQSRPTFENDEQVTINVYQRALPAVVTIRGVRSIGSSSFISADGLACRGVGEGR